MLSGCPGSWSIRLGLQDGDDIQITVAGERNLEVVADHSPAAAIARLRALDLKLPEGYRFSRNDAYDDEA